jgi:hypothetical protein
VSFFYPRVINISRQNANSAIGAQPYSGLSASNETVVASGIEARIQIQRQGSWPVAKLAGDAVGESVYRILFKSADGLVQDRDIITDDLGKRYQVVQFQWQPMITTCIAQIMET